MTRLLPRALLGLSVLCAPAFGPSAAALAQLADPGASGGFQQARPWLGVAIEKGTAGVLVKDVLKGTPAQEAGLAMGDQITAIDDTAVKQPEELIRAVQARGVGNSVNVHWLRGGRPQSHTVKLVARPDELEMLQRQLVGKPAPAFDLKVVAGDGPGSTKALSGKVALVEFWATWCPACRSTHERLSQWARAHRSTISVVAISDEDEKAIKAYAAAAKPAFTLLSDADHQTGGAWFVTAIPQLAVIDRKGTVVYATVGAGEYLEEALRAAEKAAAQP